MISFDLHMSPKTLRVNTYSVSRSSHIYTFFRNEYRGNSNEFDYLLEDENKEGIFKRVVETLSRRDNSVKVPLNSKGYTFYSTEYNHILTEDLEHNIIVPEEISVGRKAR